jgi:hypothetical protein
VPPRPDPSSAPTARLVVAYEQDVKGAAEALLALLNRATRLDEHARLRPSNTAAAQDNEATAEDSAAA